MTLLKKTILIADDEPKVVEAVQLALAEHYRVIGAADGQEAVDAALRESPQLVILDIVMPKLDGFEVLYRLKHDRRTQGIPVIILSAKGETSALFLSQDLRAADYLIKPFTIDELLAVVRQYVW